MFTEYNQQDATFLNLFISVRRSTYGFTFHHQELKTAHTVSDQYCYLLVAWPGQARLAAGSSIGLTNI